MYRTAVSLTLLSLCLLPGLAQAQSLPTSYTPVAIPTLGGRASYAYKINNLGEVAGGALTATGLVGAILWSPAAGIRSLGTLQNLGNSVGYGINDASQVTGYSSTTAGNRAFLESAGALQSLGVVPGGTSSIGWSVNNLGSVIGQSFTTTGNHAFLWANGVMKDLGTLGGRVAYALDINDANQVAGYSQNAQNLFRAFRWSNGVLQNLGTLGGNSYGYAINSAGDVVGASLLLNGARHAFLYTNGAMQDLGILGGGSGGASTAYDISDSGIVVGDSTDASGAAYAFVYAGGQMVNLNSLLPPLSGWILTSARSINANGQIAGNGYYKGQARGFVLTPGP